MRMAMPLNMSVFSSDTREYESLISPPLGVHYPSNMPANDLESLSDASSRWLSEQAAMERNAA
jgi:hypothetical protein